MNREAQRDPSLTSVEVRTRNRLLAAIVASAALWILAISLATYFRNGQNSGLRFAIALLPGALLLTVWMFFLLRKSRAA